MSFNLYLNANGYTSVEDRVAYAERVTDDEYGIILWKGIEKYGRTISAYVKKITDDDYLIARVYRYGSNYPYPVCGIGYDGTIYNKYEKSGSGIGKVEGNIVRAGYSVVGATDGYGEEQWIKCGALAALWLVVANDIRSAGGGVSVSDDSWMNIQSENKKRDEPFDMDHLGKYPALELMVIGTITGFLISGVVLLVFCAFFVAPLISFDTVYILYAAVIYGIINGINYVRLGLKTEKQVREKAEDVEEETGKDVKGWTVPFFAWICKNTEGKEVLVCSI